MEPLTNKWRSLLGHLGFGGPGGPAGWNFVPQVEHSKPLLIPIGGDSFQSIGPPPSSGSPSVAKYMYITQLLFVFLYPYVLVQNSVHNFSSHGGEFRLHKLMFRLVN